MACDESQAERDTAERNPPGFGMESGLGDVRCSVMSNEDKAGDTKSVKKVESDETHAQEKQTPADSEVATKSDCPQQAEDQEKPDAFQSGAHRRDDDAEATRSNPVLLGLYDQGRQNRVQHGCDELERGPSGRLPEPLR